MGQSKTSRSVPILFAGTPFAECLTDNSGCRSPPCLISKNTNAHAVRETGGEDRPSRRANMANQHRGGFTRRNSSPEKLTAEITAEKLTAESAESTAENLKTEPAENLKTEPAEKLKTEPAEKLKISTDAELKTEQITTDFNCCSNANKKNNKKAKKTYSRQQNNKKTTKEKKTICRL